MKNKKKLKKLILALLILIIILILSIILIINNSDETEEDVSELSASNINSEKVIPISSESFFQNYYGNVSEDDVYMTLTNIAYYIIDNKQEIDECLDEEISDIYYSNEEYFKSMGIIDELNFESLIYLAKNIDSEDLKLSYIAFDNDTITYLDEYINVDIIIKYVGIDSITVKLILANDSETENAIEVNV